MPLVLQEDGVAVHIYPIDDGKVIHCFDRNIESEIEVEVDLDSLLVAGYGQSNKLPTGKFLLKALLLCHKYHDELNLSWNEVSE